MGWPLSTCRRTERAGDLGDPQVRGHPGQLGGSRLSARADQQRQPGALGDGLGRTGGQLPVSHDDDSDHRQRLRRGYGSPTTTTSTTGTITGTITGTTTICKQPSLPRRAQATSVAAPVNCALYKRA